METWQKQCQINTVNWNWSEKRSDLKVDTKKPHKWLCFVISLYFYQCFLLYCVTHLLSCFKFTTCQVSSVCDFLPCPNVLHLHLLSLSHVLVFMTFPHLLPIEEQGCIRDAEHGGDQNTFELLVLVLGQAAITAVFSICGCTCLLHMWYPKYHMSLNPTAHFLGLTVSPPA